MNDFLNGAITGIISRLLTTPFDVVKIRMELDHGKSQSIKNMIQSIIKDEGIKGLFKGNMAGIYYYTAYNGIQFALYEKLKELKKEKNGNGKDGLSYFSRGFLASLGAICITYPLDIVRTRMTIRSTDNVYKTSIGTIINVLKTEGNIFKGIIPSIFQIAPGIGISITIYEILKEKNVMMASMMAGFLSKTIMMPFDVIRKRMQIQGSNYKNYNMSNLASYNNLIDCMIRMWREEGGWRAFFKGYTPAIMKSIPVTSITFLCYHMIKKMEN